MIRRRGGQRCYEVQAIVDEGLIECELHYLIKWRGFDHSHDTWEPISNLRSISHMLREWLLARRDRNERKKQQPNFQAIAKVVHPEYKKYEARRNQYQDEDRKPKKKLRKLEQEILSRPKVWQGYLDQETSRMRQLKEIDVDADGDVPQSNPETQYMRNSQQLMDEVLGGSDGRCEEDIVEGSEDQPETRMEEEPNDQQSHQAAPTEKRVLWRQPETVEPPQNPKREPPPPQSAKGERELRVVGQIDMTKIEQIVRRMRSGETRLLQVRVRGKDYFVRECDVRQYNPAKFIEFCEDRHLRF